MQFIILVMESTLIFPLKSFLFLLHHVSNTIKTRIGKAAQRSLKKTIPEVLRRRRANFLS